MRETTPAQLALRNGQDIRKPGIAYRGRVFDVTHSRLWPEGKHYEHGAGQDLSHELKEAPHTEEVFEKFDIIGRLKTIT